MTVRNSTSEASEEETAALAREIAPRMGKIRERVGSVIVGQAAAIDSLLLSILVGGHCLITGLPGTAKTLMVGTLARALGLTFKRIQFTPDLMPTDVTGTDILEEDAATGHKSWSFVPGPLFANIVLADEVNRTPPKTQAALLEAMQELSVTVRGATHAIAPPFLVLATQNPIELEGTYPLPEAQLDRFLFNVMLDYLSPEQEVEVLRRNASAAPPPEIEVCLGAEQIMAFRELVRAVPISQTMERFAVDLVRATRPEDPLAPGVVREFVTCGASVRATLFLVLAAKARALLDGRFHASESDIRSLAKPVLRHRVFRNYQAESRGIAIDDVIDEIDKAVEPARS